MNPAAARQGKLIVFEGPDGVGKSSLIEALAEGLRKAHISYEIVSFPGRRPGSLGLHIHELHHRPLKFGIKALHPASLQALHIAAHIDAIERRIRPSLEKGTWIILDRFWWSTWAYGTVAGVPRQSLEAMVALELTHWAGMRPDAIILVQRQTPFGRERSVTEHRRLLATYTELASEQAKLARVHVIENEGSLQTSIQRMLDAIADLLISVGSSHKKKDSGGKSGANGSSRPKKLANKIRSESGDVPPRTLHAFVRLSPIVPTEVYDT